jgi:hypothetical protein
MPAKKYTPVQAVQALRGFDVIAINKNLHEHFSTADELLQLSCAYWIHQQRDGVPMTWAEAMSEDYDVVGEYFVHEEPMSAEGKGEPQTSEPSSNARSASGACVPASADQTTGSSTGNETVPTGASSPDAASTTTTN